jgi:hypothetical protein
MKGKKIMSMAGLNRYAGDSLSLIITLKSDSLNNNIKKTYICFKMSKIK